ncbi:hypothetical protein EAH73_12665 [Hymenobacter nivis]|uniref:SMI1/KNR4 family protein n=2 Tax=Hymenobacter nivis TaxID=1850093 RepID=A0A502GWN5_9BACT|nr:hypothetical protein EAH73_12665 [Hymenobacter nivis]
MSEEVRRFWDRIKIAPEKWQEPSMGAEGGGFWVVAVLDNAIIWYNDIEEGFNTSPFTSWGSFEEYWCNQDELQWSVQNLFKMDKTSA